MERVDVELFLAIVKWNSITKASEIMHFSQPTVSYRLKVLEKEMGVQLFHRRKGVRTSELTQQGEQFIKIAERWLAVYQDTQELRHYPANLLSIGAVSSINVPILSDVYSIVSRQPYSLRLNVITKYSEELYNLIEEHSIDIGFVAEADKRKSVITIPLFQQKYYVARYARHPDIVGKVSTKDLDKTREVYMYWNSEFEQWHQNIFQEVPTYHTCVDNAALLQCFLASDGDWAIIPNSLVPALTAASRNIQIDELDVPEQIVRTCHLIKHREPRMSRLDAIELFEDKMRQSLVQNPYVELL